MDLGGHRRDQSGNQVEAILRVLAKSESVVAAAQGYTAFARTDNAYRGDYAQRVTESWAADGTASYILAHTHDRARVFAVIAGMIDVPAHSPDLLE